MSKKKLESAAVQKQFKIVYVPCDETVPMGEWVVSYQDSGENEVSCLTDHLKRHYAAYDTAHAPSATARLDQKDALRAQVSRHLKPGAQQVDDAFLEQLLSAPMIDTVPLMLNNKDNAFIAVSLYVDDQGIMKTLPVNVRASSICQEVGRPTRVLGDAFIGRYFDNENKFQRMDFTLADLNTDAPWWKTAKKANLFAASRQGETKELLAKLARTSAPQAGGTHVCGNGQTCTKVGTKRCSRCKLVWYCSSECQSKDWKRHRKECAAASAGGAGKDEPSALATSPVSAARQSAAEAAAGPPPAGGGSPGSSAMMADEAAPS